MKIKKKKCIQLSKKDQKINITNIVKQGFYKKQNLTKKQMHKTISANS